MKNILVNTLTISMFAVSSFAAQAKDPLFSLKNLERERAALISDLLDVEADSQQRMAKIKLKQRQLSDMERMVLRDERLVQSNSRLAQKAFENYDLTFLVHAGAEKQKSATEQWLSQVRLTNKSILNSKAGFR
jgi:TolA-binding protein